jgi:glycosyltransferase involved in cell wall biosynthesis
MAQRSLDALETHFDLHVFAHRQNATAGTIGTFAFGKVAAALGLLVRLLFTPSAQRGGIAYVMPAVEGFAFWRDVLICEVARWRGLQRVLHMHAKGVAAKSASSGLYRAAARRMFDGAHVIHLSPGLLDDLAGVADPEKCHVVENGVPAPAESSASSGEPVGGKVPVVLFLSNLIRSKGPLDLLAASRRLADSGVAHRLVFVGAAVDANVASDIGEAAAALPHVTWQGGVYDRSRLEAIWRDADVFVFPTHYRLECQPLVVIEAMARGKAIITTREGALPEMLDDGESALLVEPNNANELERAIRRLLSEPHYRAALGRSAHARYRDQFTLELFQERLSGTVQRIDETLCRQSLVQRAGAGANGSDAADAEAIQ